MKPIISRLVTLTPVIFAIILFTYVLEEFTENMMSEALSDLIFPVAGLVTLVVIWLYLVPVVQAYLADDSQA